MQLVTVAPGEFCLTKAILKAVVAKIDQRLATLIIHVVVACAGKVIEAGVCSDVDPRLVFLKCVSPSLVIIVVVI